MGVYPTSDDYRPGFTITEGTDLRGVRRFLQIRGYQAELHEYNETPPNPSSKALLPDSIYTEKDTYIKKLNAVLNDDNVDAVILSVDYGYVSGKTSVDSTHLIVLVSDSNGNIYLIDPDIEDPTDAVRAVDLDYLKKAIFDKPDRKRANFLAVSQ
jgi:hypothetical protein